MAFAKPKLSPVARIALGLLSQAVSIVLLLSLFFGVIPDRIDSARKLREVLSESIAQQTVTILQSSDAGRLDTLLQQALTGANDLRSIGVRRSDGRLIAEAGPHQANWQGQEAGVSTLDNVVVPITADKLHWGDVELAFNSAYPNSVLAWLRYPPVATVLLITILGFIAFYLYLRRALEYLDPMAVIPERVRMAYDTFQEAVLVLDNHAKIVLANEAFRRLHPAATTGLSGKAIAALDWLVAGIQKMDEVYPWLHAMQTKTPISGRPMEIAQPGNAESLKVVLNCTPIQDGYGNSRGCMVIFSDVTALHRANRKLLQTLDELAASKQVIEEKNKELEKLATRDPLTGCLNRRALFDAVEPLFERVRKNDEALCCVMGDIDHFKNFNDKYGHSVGDQVIKAVARTIGFGLRDGDLLCRYGGEEFCVFLPGITAEQAAVVTNRLRTQIEAEAGRSIRSQENLCITSSFGVSSIRQGALTPEALIDLADEALYHSKKSGRNRVTIWSDNMYAVE
jgi:diguanylate cyclase (GGDEF)-like protein/PAS domain S-box-containing protein